MDDQSDHDMIIELRTQMRILVGDVKEIKNHTFAALEKLDMTKFSSKDFADTWGRQVGDHEVRLRSVENVVNQSKGGFYILQSLIGFGSGIAAALIIKYFV